MPQVLPSAEPPTDERWAALGSVLLATLYLWILAWLLVAVVVPAVGFGWSPVVITSGSMEPLIRPGDVVLTSDPQVTVAPGTVITFEDPARQGSLTTHRVVSVQDDGAYRTRGDANRAADSTPVPPEAVVGVGRLLVPMVGLPLLWLSGGLLLFVIWLGVTLAATAVAVQRGGHDDRDAPPPLLAPRRPDRLTPVRPSRVPVVRPALGAAMRRLGPRSVQRTILALARRLLGPALRRIALAISAATLARSLTRVPAPHRPGARAGGWRHPGRSMAAAIPTVVPARFVLALVGVGLLASSGLGRSVAAFSAATSTTQSSFVASASFPVDPPPAPDVTTFWLQTSVEGQDANAQLTLPFATTAPTQTTLYNYSANMDSDPGRLVKRKGLGAFETDWKLIQRWSQTLTADLPLAGAQLRIFSATRNFQQGKTTTLHLFLGDCAPGGTGCAVLASTDLSRADWQGGNTGWVEDTVDFGVLSTTLSAGRELWVAVTVDNASGDDVWFAYDTVGQPSRLELTSPSAGSCPGTGSSTVIASADTYVLQDAPATNFSTQSEVLVRSTANGNGRTFLTFALPALPAGCSVTSATLTMQTVTSKQGLTYQVVRTDSAVTPATVTWADQPTATGAIGTAPSTGNGPTPLDATAPVQELYGLGNTGLVVRDAVEDSGGTDTNKYSSLEGTTDPTKQPRLTIVWGP